MANLNHFQYAMRMLRDLASMSDISGHFMLTLTFETEHDAAVFKRELCKEISPMLLNPNDLKPDKFPHTFEMVGIKVTIKHKEVNYGPRIH